MGLDQPTAVDTTGASRPAWEDRLARPMFALAVLFLVILAGLFHRLPREELFDLEQELILGGLLVVWLAMLAELAWRFLARPPDLPFWPFLLKTVLIGLVPPLRLGVRSLFRRNHVWIPCLGWQPVDNDLRSRLERFFSLPMILIALMILPLLAVDYWWSEQIKAHYFLSWAFDIGISLIWLAFAVEFILMASLAPNKGRYCVLHWIELAILLLPFIEALPVARLLQQLRFLRVDQLARMGRFYRLQALALRAWRAFLLLGIVQRLIGYNLEKRLQHLEELLAAKEEEVDQLRQEIEDLKRRLAQEQAARAVAGAGQAIPVEVTVEVPSEGAR